MEDEIGKITHYFSKIDVGIIKLTKGKLKVGDTIRIKGHTSDLTQEVESLQMEHESVDSISAGDEAGLKVKNPVRVKDKVFLVTE